MTIILTGTNPTPVLRLGWAESSATPFDLPVDGLTVSLNVASVTVANRALVSTDGGRRLCVFTTVETDVVREGRRICLIRIAT